MLNNTTQRVVYIFMCNNSAFHLV